ncbi:MAG: D-tyrosyl-tRNA(Tyr) deacylase [SAR202 cluster bacterium]|nr:D-tyrosyl-tRNA(Tyr) deacylase [SAR202 cluster bacterium]
MRALIQRVGRASVTVGGETVGAIGKGFVVLIGVSDEDTLDDARYITDKTVNLRIFNDPDGKFNLSALDVKAQLLLVSQFTLYGDTRKGRRPSFIHAARPEKAEELFNQTVGLFRESGLKVETGRFQTEMVVSLDNDGPVTIMLDSTER